METCISRENMVRFLAGEASPQQESKFAKHLSHCLQCHDLAEALSDIPFAGPRLSGRYVGAACSVDNSLHELQRRLQALALYDASDEPPAVPTASTIADGNTRGGEDSEGEAAPPQRLGKFEIIRQLGAGGFSVVYLAKDTRLNRLVALKLPRASILADPDARHRFFREAQALGRLDHPNIVSVYEAGEYDDTCYLAVEFCDGPTLDEWRRTQPAPVHPTIAARMLLTLAGAVEHAHDHGIFHRDIKPANVLLSVPPDGADQLPELRLADFGLARVIDGDTSQATLSGVVLGTPQYLAPEQAAGMTDRIGPQTDVYALGAVLYELIVGRPPILGATSIDTLRRVLVDDPAPMRDTIGCVPNALENIVAKCLEKSTEFRYLSAQDFADDLRRFLNGQWVQAGSSRLGNQRQRQRARAVTFVASVAIGLIACFAGWLTLSARKPRIADVTAKDDVSVGSASGTGLGEAPHHKPTAIPSDSNVEGHRIVPSWLAKAEGRLSNGSPLPFNLPAQRMPSIRYQQIYSKSEFDAAGTITAIRFRRDEGEPPFSTSGIDARIHLAYARTSVDEFSPVFAHNIGDNRTTVVDTQNLTLSSQGNGVPRPFDIIIPLTTPFYYDPARGDLLLEIFVRNAVATGQLDFSGRADQIQRIVTRRLFAPAPSAATGTIDFAVTPYPGGLATRFDMVFDSPSELPAAKQLAKGDPLPLWQNAMESASELMASKKFELAEPLLRDALDRSCQVLGERHSEAIEAASCLGECLARQQKFVEAERHLLTSHGYLLKLDGVNHFRIRTSCERLIQLYDDWASGDELRKWRAQWAVARRHEVAAWSSADLADQAVALQNLGYYMMKYRQAAAAEEPLRECFALRLKSLGPQHYGTVSSQHRLGECLAGLKQFEEAEKHLLKSYEDVSHHSNVPKSWRAYYCLQLVDLYRDWGKDEELERWKTQWRDDIRGETESLPASPAERSVALLRLGQTLLDHDEFVAAEPLLRECLEIRERATPRHWSTQHARSTLGACLLGQQKYQEAEPLLAAAYEGLRAKQLEIDSSNREAPAIALQRLIRLYEQWDRPADAERWKKEVN